MSGYGTMNRRITLMQEEMTTGAGGRMIRTTPVIGDVWAEVTERAAGAEERADKQIYPSSARFKIRYQLLYQETRFILWRGARFRVQGFERSLGLNPYIIFDANLIEGEKA